MIEKNNTLIKLLEIIAAPIVVAILLIIFEETARDFFFPPPPPPPTPHTPTAVEGFIKDSKERMPIPSVYVVIQGNNTFKDDTNIYGKFTLSDVPNGKLYQYCVIDKKNEPIYGINEFFFPPNVPFISLGDIFVDKPSQNKIGNNSLCNVFIPSNSQTEYQLDLIAEGTLIPEDLRKPGLKSNTHKIIVQVTANSQTLSQIERVTYYLLHSSFNPNIISSYSPEDNYSISFTAWGKVDIKAKVYFKDTKVKDLLLPKENWIIQ